MPRSPCQLTIASFLKKPPDISSQNGLGKRRGNKRPLSLSPNSANLASSKKLNDQSFESANDSAPSQLDNLGPPLLPSPPPPRKSIGKGEFVTPPPLLPYQLRPSSKSPGIKKSKLKSSTNALSLTSRMDDALLEMDQSDMAVGPVEVPTGEEADALLRDDPPVDNLANSPTSAAKAAIEAKISEELYSEISHDSQTDTLENSPTSAVKAAIEAKITEEMSSEISHFETTSKLNAVLDPNKKTLKTPTPTPVPQPLPKPLPLFPNGLPFSLNGDIHAQGGNLQKAIPAGTSKGYFTVAGNAKGQDGSSTARVSQPQPNKSKPSYAAKARSSPKDRVLVEHILFVYATWTNKAPIDSKDWGVIDSHLIGMELKQGPADPLIRIANSGYDATHKCGFIACRDQATAEWCQTAIRGIGGVQSGTRGAFRAWAKGELPEARLCRLFFPSRFDSLDENTLILSLKKHNPPLQRGTLILKATDDVQNGRALFVEFDLDSYAYVKSKSHKLEFVMMDVDCQLYNPPKRVAPTGPGITGITKISKPAQAQSHPSMNPSGSASSSLTSAANPTLVDPRLIKPRLAAAGTLSQPPSNSPLKRNRSAAFDSTDGSKRANVPNKPSE